MVQDMINLFQMKEMPQENELFIQALKDQRESIKG